MGKEAGAVRTVAVLVVLLIVLGGIVLLSNWDEPKIVGEVITGWATKDEQCKSDADCDEGLVCKKDYVSDEWGRCTTDLSVLACTEDYYQDCPYGAPPILKYKCIDGFYEDTGRECTIVRDFEKCDGEFYYPNNEICCPAISGTPEHLRPRGSETKCEDLTLIPALSGNPEGACKVNPSPPMDDRCPSTDGVDPGIIKLLIDLSNSNNGCQMTIGGTTNACHSACSDHYFGYAVDLPSGTPKELLNSFGFATPCPDTKTPYCCVDEGNHMHCRSRSAKGEGLCG
jgi:hypothetical protein